MTTTTERARIKTHVITGDQDQVWAALQLARSDGRLVALTEARALAGGRVRVVTRLRAPDGERTGWERARPWLLGAGKVLGVLVVAAVVAGAVWGLVWAVMALVALVLAAVAWVQAHLLGLVLGGIAFLALLVWLSAGGGCGGIHCGGCRG